MTVAAEEVKACCAAVYSSAAARFLLGDSFHPGGPALTSELIAALRVGPGEVVVDVACGPGTSTLQLVRESGCDAVGVDLAPPVQPSDDPRVRFLRGDAEALPLDDGSADGVLCECALCTFPDKERAAAEIARVLRPGGRLALSDMVAEQERLPEELKQLQAWVACIADARPLDEIAVLLARAGLEVDRAERRDEALAALIERIEARLQVAGMLVPAERLDRARVLAAAAARALGDGVLGYGVLVARRR